MNHKPLLLVADDEPLIRNRVKMVLGDRFEVVEAATAEETRKAAARPQDAILMDIMLPDGNGIDLCREIKRLDPHKTVVISSSMETVDAWNRAFEAGADGYLEKRDLLSMDPRKIELMISNLSERNRLRRDADEVNTRQTELLSVLSHDVRAPFQALLGTIELLRKSQIPEEASDKVEKLYACANNQLSFINSLLELLRLDSGAIKLRVGLIDINLAVAQSLGTLGVLAEAKEISVTNELGASLPRIRGDIGKIAQVANNLLSNAVKFTPRKGRILVRTAAVACAGASFAEFRVEDGGAGIKPEEAEKLCQPFRRGSGRGTEGEQGTGLGLAICRRIVDLHRGTLRFDRSSLGGAAVIVRFPAEKPDAKVPQPPKIGKRGSCA